MSIKLGVKVKDIYSGFIGMVVARTEYINGCVQCEVVPRVGKDNKLIDAVAIDEGSLVEVSVKKKSIVKKKSPGGPYRRASRMRGY